MASGYGRGGRGAALLEALNAPARRPGEGSPQTPQQQAPVAPKPIGRGQMMQALLQSGPHPQLGRGQPSVVPEQAVSSPGVVPVPLGRGAQLQAALGAQAASIVSPSRPIGRGSLAKQLGQGSQPAGSPAQPSPQQPRTPTPPKTPSPPAQSPRGQPSAPSPQAPVAEDDKRMSKLEYMLQRISTQEVVHKSGQKGQKIPLTANYIPVRCKNKGVYQYATSFSPPVDSRGMRCRLIHEHVSTFGETRAYDGAILFLPIRLPEEETVLQSVRPTDGQVITVRAKLVKVLPPESCVQLYNIMFRKIMSILRMCQVGRHYYDPHRPAPVPQHKLEVWPGYITAVSEYEGGLMMLVDVSHRVLRTETVLERMEEIIRKNRTNYKKQITEEIIGNTVLTRYNNKTYSVDDIMWDKTPMSTFESNGQDVTFVEYYKKAYNKDILDHDQPLIVHRPKPKEQERRRDRRPVLDMICLVPELCYVTGLTDTIRKDFTIMKDLAVHTRISPMQRQQSLRKFCENVNSHPEARAELEKWGLSLDLDTIQLDGRKLPVETIYLRSKSFPAGDRADWGNLLNRDKVITSVDIRNWLVVFAQRCTDQARNFVQCMQKLCPDMGWQVARPNMQALPDDRTETYLNQIRRHLTPDVQVVVAIFPSSRDDRYNAFKKLCCTESPVPSQVINDRTLKKKNLNSIVQKIGLQINCKLGGELWSVKIPTTTMMVCGIDTYHAAGQRHNSVGGFVASMNPNCTRWYSRVCHQKPGQELLDGLKVCLLAALKQYHKENHQLPERIMIFRDGVGDGQLRVVGGHEVEQLSSCFHVIDKSYQPRLGVVVVQKRINTRLFLRKGQGRNVQLDNAPPGTVMDDIVTRRDWYDFFLVSQHVGQGTVTPTHYVVVHDDLGWGPDHIQSLAYKLTHMYYNWPGTVRVPAPCQYAHKLAYLVGQNIHKDPAVELSDRLFFL